MRENMGAIPHILSLIIARKHKNITLCRKLIRRKIVICTDLCLTKHVTYIYQLSTVCTRSRFLLEKVRL